MNKTHNPEPVRLPPATTSHPSEAQAITYHDPEAPKPKRKIRWERITLVAVAVLLIAGLGSILYVKLIKDNIEPSTVNDYSGGIANPEIPKSQVTAETELAKKFLQAVQTKDSVTVQELSGSPLRQSVAQQTGAENADVLSFYEGRFDGIDFNTLISIVSDADTNSGTVGKQVTFTDKAASEGSTGTYRTVVVIITESGALRVSSVNTGLEL